MRKGNLYFNCEFCNVRFKHPAEDSVCKACDDAMIQQEREMKQAIAARAAKRKCRYCQASLSPSRYFACEFCVPPSIVELEDIVWDSAPDMDDERSSPSGHGAPAPTDKVCTRCKSRQPIAQFSPHKRGGNVRGFRPTCKSCERAVSRRQAALERKKLRELKEVARAKACLQIDSSYTSSKEKSE